MTTSAHSPRGTASDSLMVQVNPDNILQVRNAYLNAQLRLDDAVSTARLNLSATAPGRDPISLDYEKFFRDKILAVIKLHSDHVDELSEATKRLYDAALDYGHTDDAIGRSFTDFQARNTQPPRNSYAPDPFTVVDR